jgi:GNAT superfamily N-acetyltransferase
MRYVHASDILHQPALFLGMRSGVTLMYSFLLMLVIRPATICDVTLLRTLIQELAEFERDLDLCVIEEAALAQDGFGPNPKFRASIAERDGPPAGYAFFYDCYSSWAGPGLYLEDVFVRPQFRLQGIGVSLLSAVAKIAVQENRHAMRWEVLDWNESPIALYKSLGAEFRDQWKSVLLTDDALVLLAEKRS